MKRAIEYEEKQGQLKDRFAPTLVIAALIIAAVRLARDETSANLLRHSDPRLRGSSPNDFEPNREVTMPTVYKLGATPRLLPARDFKAHLETVTFIAASETESHKWWAVNVETFEKDFTKIVSPELAEEHCEPASPRRDS